MPRPPSHLSEALRSSRLRLVEHDQEIYQRCADLTGTRITAVACGHSIEIETSSGCEITIEGALELEAESRDADGTTRIEALGQTLRLQVIRDCGISQAGTLHIETEDGLLMRAPADPDYEAWNITGPDDGNLIVCMPGGDLAIWQGTPRPPTPGDHSGLRG